MEVATILGSLFAGLSVLVAIFVFRRNEDRTTFMRFRLSLVDIRQDLSHLNRLVDAPNLNQVAGLTALVQCLVQAISDQIEEGTYQMEYHPMMVQQNKWRASRFGSDARLVDSETFQQFSVQETTDRLVDLLRPNAEQLDCVKELEFATSLAEHTGAKQQLAIYEEMQDGTEVVRQMMEANNWRNLPEI